MKIINVIIVYIIWYILTLSYTLSFIFTFAIILYFYFKCKKITIRRVYKPYEIEYYLFPNQRDPFYD